ncbi:hypothetical protein R1flu_001782 [Riccia fluitans]|uniref:Uncharacterized protein n=1 Tax=Riccia fluitans TaxID=41844 RepID=A0ABD1Y792_9MARC
MGVDPKRHKIARRPHKASKKWKAGEIGTCGNTWQEFPQSGNTDNAEACEGINMESPGTSEAPPSKLDKSTNPQHFDQMVGTASQ